MDFMLPLHCSKYSPLASCHVASNALNLKFKFKNYLKKLSNEHLPCGLHALLALLKILFTWKLSWPQMLSIGMLPCVYDFLAAAVSIHN